MRSMKTSASFALTVLVALLLAGSLSACGGAATAVAPPVPAITGVDASSTAGAAQQAPAAAQGSPAPTDTVQTEAISQLSAIAVKGRAPKTGYTREQFGSAWADVDKNGCDTRNDMLRRDLTAVTYKPGTKNCVITSGTLADKYTGKTIAFTRGEDSADVQIDHIIPLSLAWQTGAQQLSADTRRELANDPLNLMAADGPANMAKSDKDAATWLPSNKAFRCEYVQRQTAVKAKYNLWMTQPEHDAIAGILNTCK